MSDFTELTGITVKADLVPEADYFTKLNTELAGGTGKHDVFMLGAYFIWQYGPAPGLAGGPETVAGERVRHERRIRLRRYLRGAANFYPLGFRTGIPSRNRGTVGVTVGLFSRTMSSLTTRGSSTTRELHSLTHRRIDRTCNGSHGSK